MKKLLLKTVLIVSCFFFSMNTLAQKLSTQEYKNILYKHLKENFYSCFGEPYPSNLYISITKKDYGTYLSLNSNSSTGSFEKHTIKGGYEYKYSGQKKQVGEFTAIIETRNSIVQQISFTRDHISECTKLYGEKRQLEEKRRYEKEEQQYKEEQIRFYKSLLNDFCSSKYSKLFSGRNYVNNSIVLTSFQHQDNYNYVYIKGTHSYRGRTGSLYKEMNFEATIEDTGRGYRITFKKRSAPDMTHSNYYWENGTGTMPYYEIY